MLRMDLLQTRADGSLVGREGDPKSASAIPGKTPSRKSLSFCASDGIYGTRSATEI